MSNLVTYHKHDQKQILARKKCLWGRQKSVMSKRGYKPKRLGTAALVHDLKRVVFQITEILFEFFD